MPDAQDISLLDHVQEGYVGILVYLCLFDALEHHHTIIKELCEISREHVDEFHKYNVVFTIVQDDQLLFMPITGAQVLE